MSFRQTFVQFLASDSDEMQRFMVKAVKDARTITLDRYSNAFELIPKDVAHQLIPFFKILQQVYANLRSSSTMDLKQNAEPETAVLSEESRIEFHKLCDKILMLACAALLDKDGNLQPSIIKAFQQGHLLDDKGAASLVTMESLKEDAEYKADPVKFTRDKLVSGFANGINLLFSKTLPKQELTTFDPKMFLGLSIDRALTAGFTKRVEEAVKNHVVKHTELTRLAGDRQDLYDQIVQDPYFHISRKFGEYVKGRFKDEGFDQILKQIMKTKDLPKAGKVISYFQKCVIKNLSLIKDKLEIHVARELKEQNKIKECFAVLSPKFQAIFDEVLDEKSKGINQKRIVGLLEEILKAVPKTDQKSKINWIAEIRDNVMRFVKKIVELQKIQPKKLSTPSKFSTPKFLAKLLQKTDKTNKTPPAVDKTESKDAGVELELEEMSALKMRKSGSGFFPVSLDTESELVMPLYDFLQSPSSDSSEEEGAVVVFHSFSPNGSGKK